MFQGALAGLMLLSVRPAAAALITVNATQTVPGQGCSFEEAVIALNTRVGGDCVAGNGVNDTIRIGANSAAFVASGINIEIRRSVTILGASTTNTVLQFSGGARGGETALLTSGGPTVNVKLQDLTLRGTAGNQLAGIRNPDTTLTLTRVRITNFGYVGINNAGTAAVDHSQIDHDGIFGELPLGGGIANHGTFTLTTSTISDNFATDGAGLVNFGSIQVSDSSFIGNQALGKGGGAYTQSPDTTFTRVVFDSNVAEVGGGLFVDVGGMGHLDQSTLISNQAVDGGGAAVEGGGAADAHIFFLQSLFAYNHADGRGGGLYSTGQIGPNCSNTTFSNNFAGTSGGGLWQESGAEFDIYFSTFAENESKGDGGGLHVTSGTSAFSFNVIAKNRAASFPDIWTNHAGLGSSDLVQNVDGVEDAFPTGNDGQNIVSVVDPKLGSLQNLGGPTAVHPLLNGSPAIDTIPSQIVATTDQRGFPRPQDGNDLQSPPRNGSDMGAYEQGPNETVFGFEAQTAWSSSVPLSLTTARKTQGLVGLSVGGSGYRTLNSAPLKTPIIPASTKLDVDFFLPGSQPNASWFGAVQAYASCPSASLNNVFLGQVELNGKPVNAFSTLEFSLPANVRTAFGQVRTDCFLSLGVNTNPTPTAPVVDNLRFVP